MRIDVYKNTISSKACCGSINAKEKSRPYWVNITDRGRLVRYYICDSTDVIEAAKIHDIVVRFLLEPTKKHPLKYNFAPEVTADLILPEAWCHAPGGRQAIHRE
jgi:hypothetical protein